MLLLEEIKNAHAKVKSGADFPLYIQDLKQLGVIRYETFVENGRTIYYDESENSIYSEAKYAPLEIAKECDSTLFITNLRRHQNGETDYLTFCQETSAAGIEKWIVDIEEMTCKYYNLEGENIYQENIPSNF